MAVYRVTAGQEGRTVKQLLSSEAALSRRMISRLMREKRVLLNKKTCPLTAAVKEGDLLEVVPASSLIDVLYESEDLIVLDKPAGIVSHASYEHPEDEAGAFLRARYGEDFVIRAVGRLDRQVSGAMLYARSKKAAAELSRQRGEGLLNKRYTALIAGIPEEKEGVFRYELGKEKGKDRQAAGSGRLCVTEYEVREAFADAACLSVVIRTGRTHQIRAGFASKGHPLLGDRLYGGRQDVIRRPALHCAEVTFTDPGTSAEVRIECPLPTDMREALGKLRDMER